MTKINLHELIELPHGVAGKKLDDAGHYRDADIKEYTVKVTGTYTPEQYTDTVTVQATNVERAFERAENLVDYDVIISCEIVEDEE
jgi:hypothetical protein